MKKLILFSILLISMLMSSQKYVKADFGKTNYKAGFSYYENGRMSTKITLIKWVKTGGLIANEYRWRAKFECAGVVVYGWTDDCWIDLYTGKAFLNERTHQITYYDEVDIIAKNKYQKHNFQQHCETLRLTKAFRILNNQL